MSSMGRRARMRRGFGTATALAALMALLGPATPARSVSGPRSSYIVELATPPSAASGGALRPLAVVERTVDSVLSAARATAAPVLHRYGTAFSGFAARLTAAEAADLAHTPGVLAVTPDTASHPLATAQQATAGGSGGAEPPQARAQTAPKSAAPAQETAEFLGLPSGLWQQLGGPDKAGEGVVVGVIDTGIYPEHPSFAGTTYSPPAGWKGTCQTGEEFTASACNNKLIGARYFVEGFGAQNLKEGEFLSPRDANGHGSHVAATAAGNHGVAPTIGGHNLGIEAVSGIAPRARIAAYKVCWTGTSAGGETLEGSCMASDAVAAIDAAVADGVDVINYSVGSSTSSVFGPVERAFLGAAAAGVFVANAAGNDGPKPGTVGSPTGVPWVTSVAATTLPRTFESTFAVSAAGAAPPLSGKGASLTGALAASPLVDSAAVPADPAQTANAALCLPGSLDPAAVAGKAVVCQRGQNARVEKSKVVLDAGGVGMVLANTKPDEDIVADLHWVPSVHVPAADGNEIRVLLAAKTPVTVTLGGGRPVAGPGDQMAAFSSRGPETAVPDISKPDLGAPGVNILAADTPTPATGDRPGETFQIISGTSMASPQVAGAAALLAQLQPDWSPAAIKSALMTSADPDVVEEDGRTPADPHDVGSGRIDPNRAARPGLVVDTPVTDYLRYLEGQDPAIVTDPAVVPLPAVDLNLPSVAVSAFTGLASTVRTLTSVDDKAQTWQATVESPAGILATVTPARFTVEPGAAQALTLTLTLGSAASDVYTSGAVVLTNTADRRTVRLPVSVQPVKIAVERSVELTAAGAAGTAPVVARPGFAGTLTALGWGLAPPQRAPGQTIATASPGTDQPWTPSAGVRTWDVTVPAGAQLLGAAVTPAGGPEPPTTLAAGLSSPATPADAPEPAPAEDLDLDLYVFRDDNKNGYEAADLIGLSAGPSADEAVAALLPAPGVYRIAVVGFKTAAPTSTFDFTTWLGVDPTPDDPATPGGGPGLVAGGDPKVVSPGDAAELELGWSGVDADGTYLGLVTYHDQLAAPGEEAAAMKPVGLTLVRVVRGQPTPVTPAIVGPAGPAVRLGPSWAPTTTS